MIVVDTNVVAYLLIQGDKTELAKQVRELDSSWLVPQLWRHEFLNVLSTYARHGGASLEQVMEIWIQALRLMARREREMDMPHALQLSVEFGVSSYDAQYISLATKTETTCITEDGQLLRAFPEICISMSDFCQTAL